MLIFPLTFIANTFVPSQNLPDGLRTIAEWNPVSSVALAAREAFGNTHPRRYLERVVLTEPHPLFVVVGRVDPGDIRSAVGSAVPGRGEPLGTPNRSMTDRRPTTSRSLLVRRLRDLGVDPGGVLVVHTAFSKVAPVDGGPEGLIAALREALGPEGTLVMPSMSDDDDHAFDPTETPARSMGIVADRFWRREGVLRSDSPHAFAAAGPKAEEIVAPHPIDFPHGLDSPVGRAYERDAQVLLLGVGHGEDTMVHLAEAIAGVRYRLEKTLTVLRDGAPQKLEYREIDHCCERFSQLDEWLDERGLQRRGTVGHAEARLVRSRDVVEEATRRLSDDETIFLHPPGVDAECDTARASLDGLPRWGSGR